MQLHAGLAQQCGQLKQMPQVPDWWKTANSVLILASTGPLFCFLDWKREEEEIKRGERARTWKSEKST